MRAESEVGVQRDTQDFRGSVQWDNHVADSHLKVESGSTGPPHQRGAELVRPRLGLHDDGSKGQHCEVVDVGRHVKVGDGAVRHKMVEGGWGYNGSLWDHSLYTWREGEWCCW